MDTTTDPTSDIELTLTGMTCASCANRIERKLNKLHGVQASVNYATEKATVTTPEGYDLAIMVAGLRNVSEDLAGLGVGFLSLQAAGLEITTGVLKIAAVEGTPVMRAWHVVHLMSRVLSPAAEAFRYFLLEEAEADLALQDARLMQVASG